MELELMISGMPEIDVNDMKANTVIKSFSNTSRTIHWFWEVMKELERQDLALFVQFVTGTSKVPLGGFKDLQASVLFLGGSLVGKSSTAMSNTFQALARKGPKNREHSVVHKCKQRFAVAHPRNCQL